MSTRIPSPHRGSALSRHAGSDGAAAAGFRAALCLRLRQARYSGHHALSAQARRDRHQRDVGGCFMVVHPRGTLMWDVGAVPDSAIPPGGTGTLRIYGTSTEDAAQVRWPRSAAHRRISPICPSALHWDHVGNANQFAGRDLAGAREGARAHVRRSAVAAHGAREFQRAQDQQRQPSSRMPTTTCSAMEPW